MSDHVPMAQGATGLMTEDSYSPELKAEAYKAYMETGLSPAEVAIKVGVPLHLMESWCRGGNWPRRRRAFEEDLLRDADMQHRKWASQERLDVAKGHLVLARQIEEAIGKAIQSIKTLPEKEQSMAIKRLAEALADTATVSSRAVGLDGNSRISPESLQEGATKRPFLYFNLAPQVERLQDRGAHDSRKPPIEVTVEENERYEDR